MLTQEEVHRYFNHLSGAKRIEFLYGLLHLCQPLELRYLGTCLEEIARKDYEYLYHAEQKTNYLLVQNAQSATAGTNEPPSQPSEPAADEKFDLTDQFTRAHAIVDIALLWAKNRACAIRLYRRLKASESVKLVDMLLERDDLDERTMDEILIIFCLAANHPAFSFDMRTQMAQIFKELEKRQRKMKLLQTVQHNQPEDEDDTLEDSSCLNQHMLSTSTQSCNTLSVHASPLLTRLTVVNFDTDSTPMRVLIRADWSDNNSTLAWKTPNDIRSFHLQLSNIVYHDDMRLERLMNISGYLRDVGSPTEPDTEQMKKNITAYMAHLVYFSSYISTISTLAKFFNSSLKLVDSKLRLFNSTSSAFDESLPASPTYSNGLTPLQCEVPIQQVSDGDSKTLCSPKLSLSANKPMQARSTAPSHNGTQTGLDVRCEETQTDRMPGPGFILAEYQDYLRRYTMDELAKLTPNDLIVDGLDPGIAQLLCGALDDLKPMSIHLSNSSKTARSPSTFVQIPPPSSSTPPPPPLLDAALLTVVQQQQPSASRTPPPGFDRNQYEQILINFSGVRSSKSSSLSPKTSMVASNSNTAPSASSSSANGAVLSQHHVPLLTAHSFLYNPVEPCIFPIAIPPGYPSASSDFMRLFTPNMAAVAAAAVANVGNPSSGSQPASMSTSRSTAQSNGTSTPPEQNGHHLHHSSASTSTAAATRHQHFRHRQHYSSDSQQYASSSLHRHPRQSQPSYAQQQQHNYPKACYTCGGIGHLAFACSEQYLSDSNYSHSTREGYRLDYRPRQTTPTNFHQQQHRQLRSHSNSKAKLRDNS